MAPRQPSFNLLALKLHPFVSLEYSLRQLCKKSETKAFFIVELLILLEEMKDTWFRSLDLQFTSHKNSK